MAAGLVRPARHRAVWLLVFAAEPMFAILLGPAATMPPAVSWILIILLVANLVQTVSNFCLVHTGSSK